MNINQELSEITEKLLKKYKETKDIEIMEAAIQLETIKSKILHPTPRSKRPRLEYTQKELASGTIRKYYYLAYDEIDEQGVSYKRTKYLGTEEAIYRMIQNNPNLFSNL